MAASVENTVAAWWRGGVLFESYRYAPGSVEAPPQHAHQEYQFGLCVHSFGEYRYRGSRVVVPVGAVSAIQSGEPHRSRDVEDRLHAAAYPMAYASPALLEGILAEVSGRAGVEPFFPEPVLDDRELAGSFLRLFSEEHAFGSGLEHDSLLLSFLSRLLSRHAAGRPAGLVVGKERASVRLAREYLEDNLARNVSIAELCAVANLSPYHLVRVFAREVGVPPHAYQLQARVAHAKALLLGGRSASDAATETGFYDQAHFARHFKRLVGVPPGRYARKQQ